MNKLINFGVGFNTDKANETISLWLEPLTQWMNFIIPGATALVCLVIAVMFFMDEEEKREQKPYLKRIKPILITAIIALSINVILQIFGIAS